MDGTTTTATTTATATTTMKMATLRIRWQQQQQQLNTKWHRKYWKKHSVSYKQNHISKNRTKCDNNSNNISNIVVTVTTATTAGVATAAKKYKSKPISVASAKVIAKTTAKAKITTIAVATARLHSSNNQSPRRQWNDLTRDSGEFLNCRVELEVHKATGSTYLYKMCAVYNCKSVWSWHPKENKRFDDLSSPSLPTNYDLKVGFVCFRHLFNFKFRHCSEYLRKNNPPNQSFQNLAGWDNLARIGFR